VSDVRLLIAGGALGLVVYLLWKSRSVNNGPPELAPGQAFGPPVPTGTGPVTPGPISLNNAGLANGPPELAPGEAFGPALPDGLSMEPAAIHVEGLS